MALRKELIALGYNDRSLAALVRQGVLAKPRRGAYADGPTYAGLDPAGRHAVCTRAVRRQAGTAVVASHVSAAVEWDAPTWGLDLSRTQVTRQDGKAGRKEAGVQQHCGRILDGDVVERNGIEVMSGTRTALEVTTAARAEAALAVTNHLLHRGATTQEELAARYAHPEASMEHWPNSLTTDLVLRLADPRVESLGESRTFYLCFRHGLPLPTPQVEVRDDTGLVVARVDFAWPERGVYLEVDGRIKYQQYLRPGESVTDAVLREKQRESLICRLTGWRCIRLTWDDLGHPERTAAIIRAELARAAAA